MNCRFDAIPLTIFELRPLYNCCALTSSACSELFHHLCSLAVAKILRFNHDFTSWIHRKMTCWQPSDEKELCMSCIPVPLEIFTTATFQKLLHDNQICTNPLHSLSAHCPCKTAKTKSIHFALTRQSQRWGKQANLSKPFTQRSCTRSAEESSSLCNGMQEACTMTDRHE